MKARFTLWTRELARLRRARARTHERLGALPAERGAGALPAASAAARGHTALMGAQLRSRRGAQGLAARVQLREEIGRARMRGVGRVGERMRESGGEGGRESGAGRGGRKEREERVGGAAGYERRREGQGEDPLSERGREREGPRDPAP